MRVPHSAFSWKFPLLSLKGCDFAQKRRTLLGVYLVCVHVVGFHSVGDGDLLILGLKVVSRVWLVMLSLLSLADRN